MSKQEKERSIQIVINHDLLQMKRQCKICLHIKKKFQSDPFDLSDTTLRLLQSGLCTTDELLVDITTAKFDRENMSREFMGERVYAKS